MNLFNITLKANVAKQHFRWLIALFLLAPLSVAHSEPASPAFIQALVPGASEVGKGRYSVLFWDIYDARLLAPDGQWQRHLPFALSLTYLRDFEGRDIAQRSVKEMRRQSNVTEEELTAWLSLMEGVFPDVNSGDTLTGIYRNDDSAVFFLNGKKIGEIATPGFALHFFSIWLGEQTSEPDFRDKLLAGAKK